MKTTTLTIINSTGLHARPAKFFVNLAKQFEAEISVQYGQKQVNAKSLISLLTLGVKPNDTVLLTVTGADEEKAIEALQLAVWEGLGEKHTEKPEPETTEPLEKPVQHSDDVHCLAGVSISPGVAIGPVFRFLPKINRAERVFRSVMEECADFDAALKQVRTKIQQMGLALEHKLSPVEKDVLNVHLEILNDSDIIHSVKNRIEQHNSAVNAWQAVMDDWVVQLSGAASEVIRTRVADLQDIRKQVLTCLAGETTGNEIPDTPVIIFARELLPSDTMGFAQKKVTGIALVEGRTTDHAAILARALGIPAVSGLPADLLERNCAGQVILDGQQGLVIIDPLESELTQAQTAMDIWKQQLNAAEQQAALQAKTLDGFVIEVAANIGNVEDAQRAYQKGADGVGLLRTEFLFTGRKTAPDEEEQYQVYRAIVDALKGSPLLLRTLDIGGDKPIPFIKFEQENNPFLGERGVRLTLRETDLMKTQIRAALRAAVHGPLRVMFPMVGDYEEWSAAKSLVLALAKEMDLNFLEIGIMVEVPSAVVMADIFAEEVDFFSIGTNDLTQYTLAMDRTHKQLGMKLDGLHPAVLRLIRQTVEAAHAKGKWVGICGELAADPVAVPLLVGLGVDELSVNVPAIPLVKAQIRSLKRSNTEQLAAKALACRTSAEVRVLARDWKE
jgi:phosphocarrier protein FPr